ncbi:MAG: hypothetical protein KJO44_07865 [Gemmatimonadetes bacterium]|nr:hypothetical protein [Gemmatimonadota bacterium]NNK48518.1 hypothetical protein [Gemmatimonadota bacterium]
MTGNPTFRWLRPRVLEAPPELAADIIRLVESTPGLDLSDPVTALATAALAGLEEVAEGAGNRSEALRLLAADAALTYAFEAAAGAGRSKELATRLGLDGELGKRLERQVYAPGLPGHAEGS